MSAPPLSASPAPAVVPSHGAEQLVGAGPPPLPHEPLSDADLDDVVGGLTRFWLGPPTADGVSYRGTDEVSRA